MVSVLLLGTVCSGNQRHPVVSDQVAQAHPRLLVEKASPQWVLWGSPGLPVGIA